MWSARSFTRRFKRTGWIYLSSATVQMIDASRARQQAMREIVSVYLQRIERDTRGLPIKLYPSGTGIPVSAIY